MKYTIEVTYLLPVYKTMVVEADTLEEACKKANETADEDGWEFAKDDYDSCTTHFVTAAARDEWENPHVADEQFSLADIPESETIIGREVLSELVRA